MGTRVTLKDVAAAVGVSPATVSLVLNGKPVRISDERRAQIQKVASSMRYRPNQAARALVTRRSNMVGLVVPDIENMFFSSLFKALEDVAIRDGYSVIVANSDDSRERERSLICGVSARGVDGLFLVPALQSCAQEAALRRDVEECPCPVVFVDRLVDSGYCDGVGVDNEEGGRLAAEVLIDSLAAGARDARKGRVGCVCVERVDGISDLRFRGFADALAKAGVPLDAECIVKGITGIRAGMKPPIACWMPVSAPCSARTTLWPWGFAGVWRSVGCMCLKTCRLWATTMCCPDSACLTI